MIKANILPNGEIIADSNAVSDSINFDTIEFTFPLSWDGLSKTVVFSNAGKTVNVILAVNVNGGLLHLPSRSRRY